MTGLSKTLTVLGGLLSLLFVSPVLAEGGELFPVEEYAGGGGYLGLSRFGVSLAGPLETAINPAGLALAERTEFSATVTANSYYVPYSAWTKAEEYDSLFSCYSVSVVKPMRTESANLGEMNTLAVLGVSLHQLEYGEIQGRDDEGELTGISYSPSQSLAAITVGTELDDDLAVGINLKVLAIDNGKYSDSGFGLDLGLNYHPHDLRVGFSIVDLLPPGINLGGANRIARRVMRLGVGYEFFRLITPAFEATYVAGTDEYRYGACARFLWDGDNWRLGIGSGYDIGKERWSIDFILGIDPVEVSYSRYILDQLGICHSIRISFTPEF